MRRPFCFCSVLLAMGEEFLGTPSEMTSYDLRKVYTKFGAFVHDVTVWPFFGVKGPHYMPSAVATAQTRGTPLGMGRRITYMLSAVATTLLKPGPALFPTLWRRMPGQHSPVTPIPPSNSSSSAGSASSARLASDNARIEDAYARLLQEDEFSNFDELVEKIKSKNAQLLTGMTSIYVADYVVFCYLGI